MSGGERDGADVRAWAVNLTLRAMIVAYAIEAALANGDPRFDGKGIAVRNIVFGGACLTLAFPLLHAWRRPWPRYPVWSDSLFLSILALDMAFNSLDLYERGGRLDLIPHTYGPAAGFATLRSIGVGVLPGTLLINSVHLLLEVQEAVGDAVFGTHNVRGWWDTITDLAAGFVGSVGLPLVWYRLRGRIGGSRRGRAHRSYSPA